MAARKTNPAAVPELEALDLESGGYILRRVLRYLRCSCLVRLVIILFATWSSGWADPGEFTIRTVTPLNRAQLLRLRQIIDANTDASALAHRIRDEARPYLNANPQPLEVIHYQGLLNNDPRRIASVVKLQTMDHIAALTRYWQASGDEEVAMALRRHILAWCATYKPTGDDVNENKLYPLFVAVAGLVETGIFTDLERQTVLAWVSQMAALHETALAGDSPNNRYTKRLRLLLVFGQILGKEDYAELARLGVKHFVADGLYPDGESLDLRTRDTLTYHISALEPVVEIAILLQVSNGNSLYSWESSAGASLKKSVEYVLPYLSGEKTRTEWTHSKVPLDHKRAAAGIDKYQPGSLFDPDEALDLLLLAEFFEPQLQGIIVGLSPDHESRYEHWQLLVNEALRTGECSESRFPTENFSLLPTN